MLLGPAVAAHAPPARAGTVDLQHVVSRHEAHWVGEEQGVGEKGNAKRSRFSFGRPGLCTCADKRSSVFTWEGGVDLLSRQARELILPAGAVVLPVAGLLQRYEPHRSLAEEILAVDQLLDCGGEERERQQRRRQTRFTTALPGRRRRRSGDSLKKAVVARMASITTTTKMVSTRFLLDHLVFSVFGAFIGLLWWPCRGATGMKATQQH